MCNLPLVYITLCIFVISSILVPVLTKTVVHPHHSHTSFAQTDETK